MKRASSTFWNNRDIYGVTGFILCRNAHPRSVFSGPAFIIARAGHDANLLGPMTLYPHMTLSHAIMAFQ
jgi:hypothetical protein